MHSHAGHSLRYSGVPFCLKSRTCPSNPLHGMRLNVASLFGIGFIFEIEQDVFREQRHRQDDGKDDVLHRSILCV